MPDLRRVSGRKRDIGLLAENFLAMPAQVNQTNARDHLMGLALARPSTISLRFRQIGRFAEQYRTQRHHRVHAEGDGIGKCFWKRPGPCDRR
jgi:hypothetical protein